MYFLISKFLLVFNIQLLENSQILKQMKLSMCITCVKYDNEIDQQIFMKVHIGEFYKKLWSHFSFHLDQTVLMTTLHKSINTFLILRQCDCI
jgi:hypothetical protein